MYETREQKQAENTEVLLIKLLLDLYCTYETVNCTINYWCGGSPVKANVMTWFTCQ